jgi:hypothetical protein
MRNQNKKRITLATLFTLLLLPISVKASELTHDFMSPAFNGQGYSSHILTIEQIQANRKKELKDEAQAEEDRLERERKSTNAYKFQNNLESRIYATLSKNIADQLFGETGEGTVDGEWYIAESPFGDEISWMRLDGRIYVTIKDSNGDIISEFDVPVGDFAF